MRHLVATLAITVIAAACATPPAPTATTPAPAATAGPTTAEPMEAAQPSPTMPPFTAPYPDAGWAVAASVDSTGDVARITSNGLVKAGALLDLAFACGQPTTIKVRATDAATGDVVLVVEAPCRPDVARSTAPSIATDMTINVDATVGSNVRYWAKLGVPTENFVPFEGAGGG